MELLVENDNNIVVRGLKKAFERTAVTDANLVFTLVERKEDGEQIITGMSNATPIVVTSAAHGLSNGDKVLIRFAEGNTAANRGVWTVANKTTDTFELATSTGNGSWIRNGEWWLVVPNAAEVTMTYSSTQDAYKGVAEGTLSLDLDTRYNCYIVDQGVYAEDLAFFADVTINERVR